MTNPENVINKGKNFTKDYQPEKNGRPKGMRNRSTLINEILDHIKEGKDMGDNVSKREAEYWMMIRKYQNAMQSKDIGGSNKAIDTIMDWKYGKQEEKVINANIECRDATSSELLQWFGESFRKPKDTSDKGSN